MNLFDMPQKEFHQIICLLLFTDIFTEQLHGIAISHFFFFTKITVSQLACLCLSMISYLYVSRQTWSLPYTVQKKKTKKTTIFSAYMDRKIA